MRSLLVYLLFLSTCYSFAQTLKLPPRSVSAMNGAQFVATISSSSMGLTTREDLIYNQISAGNVPNFMRTLKPVTSTASISGTTQSVTYYVIPDYLAVGHDTNYFLCPMSPMLATRIGNLTKCTLPTRKMVNDIWSAASVKLSPTSISASSTMTTVPVFDQHNSMVRTQRQNVVNTYPLGELVGGDKKDVVISNLIYSTTGKVIIYGWHQTNGSPIQPLSSVHSDTYMDYSHGIRLVQDSVVYNGTATTVKSILKSSTLYPLLSDEGVMSKPYYPYYQTITSLNTPISFALLRESANSLRLKITNDVDATDYKAYVSTNGTSFSSPVTLSKSNTLITGLQSSQIYFVKIAAYNSSAAVTSSVSEVLAAVTSDSPDSTLIVQAFDRNITGNTYNFCIQHGNALNNSGKIFSSATNEAVVNNLVSLGDYKIVDYILGQESTVNETFSISEQTLISSFLNNGGCLFISGSEIAWDLDYKGTASDKSFINNYLKVYYAADAPGGTANSCYSASATSSAFYDAALINFDNGTHGTYNVSYPDVITPASGAISDLLYSIGVNQTAAIHFKGLFPNGSAPGKLVYLGFPFEAIYEASQRDSLMKKIISFFDQTDDIVTSDGNWTEEPHVYPNPVISEAKIFLSLKKSEAITIEILDQIGRTVFSKTSQFIEGQNSVDFDKEDLPSGIYLLSLKGETSSKTLRVVFR